MDHLTDNKKSRILIVDDTPKNIQILATILRNEGYQLNIAQNGLQALAIVEEIIPDLILLDVMMPEIDGFETCKRLKAINKIKNIPIIFLTAKVEVDDIVNGLKLGAVDYINKPFKQVELIARVKNHLELKFARERVEQLNKELQDNLKMREVLSNMIVHDMRTPLTSIIGLASLSRLKLNIPDLNDYMKKIEKSASRVNSFLNDMLALAKMKENKLILNCVDSDLVNLIEAACENFAELAQSQNIILEFIRPPGSIELLFLDVNLLSRVLDNLISNAMKFAPAHSKITLRVDKPSLAITEKHEKAKVCIKVIDQGPGIPKENRERIFDLFESGKSTRKEMLSFGLGLTFCRMVIDAHGGKIFANQNEPNGTVMTIIL